MRSILFYFFLFVNVFVMASEYSNNEMFLKNAVKIMQKQQQTIHDLQLSLSELKSEQVNLKNKLSNPGMHNFYSNSVETVQETWPSVSQWWVLSLAVILLWLMLELGDSVSVKQNNKTSSVNENKDNEFEKLDEYDFLNTTEGMDSQLDLARAYIEMGDMFAARETVDLVLSSGNVEQMKQAEILLADIRSQELR